MRRAILSVLVTASMAVPMRSAAAASTISTTVSPTVSMATMATAEPSPKVAELQALHGRAQERVQLYNTSHDLAHLTEARDLLARWLVEHRALYGDTPEATNVRAPIEQQLGQIDAEITRVQPAVATQPTPPLGPEPTPQPAVADPTDMPPPRMTSEQAAELRSAKGLLAGGATLFTVGSLTLLAVSLPLWALRNQALERANQQTFYADEQRLIGRARRRQIGAIITLAAGAAMFGGGLAMMTVGGVRRARVRRELSLLPALGPGFAGASATLRF